MTELLCPFFSVTFYPSGYPATAGGIVLLGAEGDYIDKGSTLGGSVGQLIQAAQAVRGATPALHVRGGRVSALEFETVRKIADPGEALATALESVAALPATVGWCLVAIASEARQWAIVPAACESAGWSHQAREGLLRLKWAVKAGVMDELATTSEDTARLWDTGHEVLWEDGSWVQLET